MAPDDDKAARKLFRQEDAAKALSEHAKEQKRFSDNRERLKAERLAREKAAALAPKDTPLQRNKRKLARKPDSI